MTNDDLIRRGDAIDEFDGVKVDEENCTEYDIGYNDGIDFAVSRLSVLPSAQPETSEWIETEVIYKAEASKAIDAWQSARCKKCGLYHTTPYMYGFHSFAYCPNCGRKMRGEEEKNENE